MVRVALVPSEPIRARMAGIGIRYLEMARRLPAHGLDIVLVTSGDPAEVPGELVAADVRRFVRGELATALADCDAVVTQGQLANDVLLEAPDLPAAVDFYDPFLIENLTYAADLGLDPYRNDHATWVLQLGRGDFFLCSCAEQRLFYLGFLAAMGRLNPRRVAEDPDLDGLIATVPFGVPDELPARQALLDARPPGERRLLFGGLYDWYDPWPVLEAVATLDAQVALYIVRNPNATGTPQRVFEEVRRWCEERDLWGSRVRALDWVSAERRFDLLRDVDALVATHRTSLETRLSLRTRFLEALAVGCPVVTSAGGALSRMLDEHDAGWVVPPGDASAVGRALREILAGGDDVERRVSAGHELAARFSWDQGLRPLVRFLRQPVSDPTKDDFAFRPSTLAPPDTLPFRVRRWWRQTLGG